MSTTKHEYLDLAELCQTISLTEEIVIEIVDLGIVEPSGRNPKEWQFDIQMIATTRKALRLHYDLDIDWPGIALAVSLLDELEQLRMEKRALESRLGRYEK